MDGAAVLADEINELGGTLKRGSLIVFGDCFGRPFDNIHTVVGATAETQNTLVVRFDEDAHRPGPDRGRDEPC